MHKENPGLPGITPDIFKEFIQEMMLKFVNESRPEILKTYKGKQHFFTYEITDLGTFDVEVRAEGDHIIYWTPTGQARLKYSADSIAFDDVMTARVAPFDAFFRRRIKVKGSVGEAIKLLSIIPPLQKAYIKTRQEISQKYGLEELNREYPIPADFG